jgi:hypothetical protein
LPIARPSSCSIAPDGLARTPSSIALQSIGRTIKMSKDVELTMLSASRGAARRGRCVIEKSSQKNHTWDKVYDLAIFDRRRHLEILRRCLLIVRIPRESWLPIMSRGREVSIDSEGLSLGGGWEDAIVMFSGPRL